MSIKVGIVGAGGMLQYHAAGFKAAGAELLAVCDMNQASAQQPRIFMKSHMFILICRRCWMNLVILMP